MRRARPIAVDVRGVSRDLARWAVEDAPATLVSSRFKVPARSSYRPAEVVAVCGRCNAVAGLAGSAPWPCSRSFSLAATQTQYVGQSSNSFEPRIGRSAGGHVPRQRQPAALRGAVQDDDLSVSARMMARRSPAEETTAASVVCPWRPGREAARRSARHPQLPAPQLSACRRAISQATRSNVDRLVGELQGWYRHVNIAGGGSENQSLSAIVQVPSARLEEALGKLKALGTVISESQNGEDVGNQIIDVEARLSNARNTERRLADLLQRRTGELEQVLAAEREIARVREEIERFVAHRKGLGDRVTYCIADAGGHRS